MFGARMAASLATILSCLFLTGCEKPIKKFAACIEGGKETSITPSIVHKACAAKFESDLPVPLQWGGSYIGCREERRAGLLGLPTGEYKSVPCRQFSIRFLNESKDVVVTQVSGFLKHPKGDKEPFTFEGWVEPGASADFTFDTQYRPEGDQTSADDIALRLESTKGIKLEF